MKRFIKSKKGIALLATLVVAAVAAFGAYAYFTSTGSGTGTATVGTANNWVVAVSAPTGGPLYPGHGAEDFTYTVTNPAGGGNQELNQVTLRIANANGSAWNSGACTKNDFSIEAGTPGNTITQTYGGASNDVSPGDSRPGDFEVTMVDTGAPQDDCQGVTPPILVSAS